LNFPFYIASRYLVSKKSTNAISIISWISVISIAVVTAALIIVLSGMNGLTGLVTDLYNSFESDLEIKSKNGKSFVITEQHLNKIKTLPEIKESVFCIEDKALVKYNDRQSIVTIKGVSKNFLNVSHFDTLVYEGSFVLKQRDADFGVFGKGVAYRLGINLADAFSPITLFSPKRGKQSSINPEEAFNEFKIYPSGIFSINDEFDFKYAIVDIDMAKQLFDFEQNEITALELKCGTSENIKLVQDKLSALLGNEFIIKNRYQQNELLFKTLETEKLWTFIILVFILIVATFNIIGALTMLIIEKKKDIVILNNLGCDAKTIRKIFMIEGFLITTIGSIIGLLLGFTLCWLQLKYGFIRFDEGFVVDAYPVKILLKDFVAVILVVLFIGLSAAWYPVHLFTNKSMMKQLSN
jgi:lipoprotein-releasing system permease protein